MRNEGEDFQTSSTDISEDMSCNWSRTGRRYASKERSPGAALQLLSQQNLSSGLALTIPESLDDFTLSLTEEP